MRSEAARRGTALLPVPPMLLLAAAATPALATDYLSVPQASQLMFAQATSFEARVWTLDAAELREVQRLSELPPRSPRWRVLQAQRDGATLGYVVLDEVVGKVELISYAVALNPDGSLRQLEILSYRESHGYEVRQPAWRRQFAGKTLGDGLRLGEGIANISGATLSCQHVTDGVRRIVAVAQVVLRR